MWRPEARPYGVGDRVRFRRNIPERKLRTFLHPDPIIINLSERSGQIKRAVKTLDGSFTYRVVLDDPDISTPYEVIGEGGVRDGWKANHHDLEFYCIEKANQSKKKESVAFLSEIKPDFSKMIRPSDIFDLGQKVLLPYGKQGTIIEKRWNSCVVEIYGDGNLIFPVNMIEPSNA